MALLLLLFACDVPIPGAPRPGGYGVHGIDVSHHQGRVDWDRVAASGRVDFVYLKATEGRSHVDRRFAENWTGARRAGLAVGAYHYFSLCRGADEQVAHFVSRVPDVPDMLPPVVDIEPDRRCNRAERIPGAAKAISSWLAGVEAHFGVRPLVYSSDRFRGDRLSGVDASHWTAAYSRSPRLEWTFWQYTDHARIPGIRGPVDGNVFAGSHHELEALARRSQ